MFLREETTNEPESTRGRNGEKMAKRNIDEDISALFLRSNVLNDLFGTQQRIQVMNIYDSERAISCFRTWYTNYCHAKKMEKK